jgi:hypothetical protein
MDRNRAFTLVNDSIDLYQNEMCLTPFLLRKFLVGRHMLRCSWRFIIFYFGICERMLLFGKRRRLAGTYGKCWNTWDLHMRIQGTCVIWRRGNWTSAVHDGFMARIFSTTQTQTLCITGGLVWQSVIFKTFISVSGTWSCSERE